ncbi:SDR family oxidoreductase [Chitinophaga polysaccharea]|uniref:SDR family oxidoreductase n=1 Tax=Chitinophaga polysaccharea TaxID=1293035 RepID=UPI0011570516|nr:SDR family oxidoreductase [Chitinophaga polysaccharea]
MQQSFSSIARYEPESLTGKNILITGGTTGIGRSTALLLGAYGARVMVFGRHRPELDDTLKAFKDVGMEDKVYGFTADIAEKKGIEETFRQVDKHFEKLDVLINNAALPFKGIQEGTYEDWQYVLNTNLLAYLACSNEAIKRMKEKNGGQIVFIGSLSADVRSANSSVYTATKAGIQAFSEALRKEVQSLNIKVSLIEPGLVGTDLLEMPAEKKEEMQQKQEMLFPEDIAALVLFLLQQPWRCNLMTSSILPINQSV